MNPEQTVNDAITALANARAAYFTAVRNDEGEVPGEVPPLAPQSAPSSALDPPRVS